MSLIPAAQEPDLPGRRSLCLPEDEPQIQSTNDHGNHLPSTMSPNGYLPVGLGRATLGVNSGRLSSVSRPTRSAGVPHQNTRIASSPSSRTGPVSRRNRARPSHRHPSRPSSAAPFAGAVDGVAWDNQTAMAMYPRRESYLSSSPSVATSSYGQQDMATFSYSPSPQASRRHPSSIFPGHFDPSRHVVRSLTMVESGMSMCAVMVGGYRDSFAFQEFLLKVPHHLSTRLRPWPQGRTTRTAAGFNPQGGDFVELRLRDRELDREFVLRVTVISRQEVPDRNFTRAFDMVLGQDYQESFVAGNTPAYTDDLISWPDAQYQNMAGSLPSTMADPSPNTMFGQGVENQPLRTDPSFEYSLGSAPNLFTTPAVGPNASFPQEDMQVDAWPSFHDLSLGEMAGVEEDQEMEPPEPDLDGMV